MSSHEMLHIRNSHKCLELLGETLLRHHSMQQNFETFNQQYQLDGFYRANLLNFCFHINISLCVGSLQQLIRTCAQLRLRRRTRKMVIMVLFAIATWLASKVPAA